MDLRELRVGVVSSFPPTRCGVGKFSEALCRVWRVLAPNFDLRVNRIVTGSDAMVPDELVEAVFDPSSPAAVRSVARRLDRHDVVLVHHEFGLYGPGSGRAVVELTEDLGVPVVSVLHTVLARPSGEHCQIIEALAGNGPLVVPTETARERLLGTHEVGPAAVQVINHGTSWTAAPVRRGRRRKLISWGLLGPGKGIERALQALALLDLDPPATYDIVGQTHPRVRERYGERYRLSLEELTRYLGLEEQVRFVDRYVPEDELKWMVAHSDVAVLPFDDPDQICSGTLVDAVALGKPVVATDFPHAREALADGAGYAVDRNPDALAAAIARLLVDDEVYAHAAQRAARQGPAHAWEKVSASYAEALHRARAGVGVA